MSAGPSLRSQKLWAKREARCLAILERALSLLRIETQLPEAEVDLNRRLYFCLLKAARELYPNDEIAPTPECNNQPDPSDEARATREQKRPDFQWIYLDKYESDSSRSSKQFVVECKRLGKPVRSDWVLNANYVNHGVRRFRETGWAYAKRFASGAMIGYMQSMELDDVLGEVNAELRKNSLSDIACKRGWRPSDVSHLEHSFDRPFEVSPFSLKHLWVDLR
jgi:hypothetical protein